MTNKENPLREFDKNIIFKVKIGGGDFSHLKENGPLLLKS